MGDDTETVLTSAEHALRHSGETWVLDYVEHGLGACSSCGARVALPQCVTAPR